LNAVSEDEEAVDLLSANNHYQEPTGVTMMVMTRGDNDGERTTLLRNRKGACNKTVQVN
jgi:hypothetical protein